MEPTEVRRATTAALSTASALGLEAEDAVVLNDSNRLVVRLVPCDIVVRVTPTTHHAGHQMSPEREVEVVDRLAPTAAPVATLDARVEPRVVVHDGFEITLWTYYEPIRSLPISPADYAQALQRLHAGLRQVEVAVPHAMDRVTAVQQDVADREATPELGETDRDFLAGMLRELRRSIAGRQPPEQLLHGEPHPGNLLSTKDGPLFTDFENTARGPVEYDLGWVPQDVGDRCPGADQALLDECRGLVLAMIATYRWRRDDQHPSGRASGLAFLDALRHGPPWPSLDQVSW